MGERRFEVMSGNVLLMVAEDQRLAEALQAQLQPFSDQPAFICSFGTVRDYLGPDVAGLVLAAATGPADFPKVRHLVQELHLRQWPARVLLMETPGTTRRNDLVALDPYLAGRFAWPERAPALVSRLCDLRQRERFRSPVQKESLETVIRRRLLCQTPSLMPLAEPLALAARHDVTVLLTGETGTGKTHLARLIHTLSPRNEQGFLVVPCGALAVNLIESEFFGHVKGAFTGADRTKEGKFQAAGSGTILLDEIDALPLEQQANLLRVLETGEFEPVGGNDTLQCQARIIVASNWDLEQAVAQGKFRQDLFYRLNVMPLPLPPLRERVQDIAPLVRGLVARFALKFGKALFDISPEAMEVLERFAWPGNIRQLENVIQQAVLISAGAELRRDHLPHAIQEFVTLNPVTNGRLTSSSLVQNREARERALIERTVVANSYSRARAADALGISRVTLYKKMRKYGLLDMPRHSR
jgi:transcriptional regulator with PAS, ATPase and Fis domain